MAARGLSVDVRLRRGDREHPVSLTIERDGATATLAGVAHRIALLASGPRATLDGLGVEELRLEIDGTACRALVAIGRDQVTVALRGRVYTFDTGDESRRTSARRGSSGTVIAPMPGKVTAVLVAVGDEVEPGSPLVVLEAMKMESTLTAEIAGRVTTVRAVAGALVTAGDVLVEIAPVVPDA